jgi:hypothetical protein
VTPDEIDRHTSAAVPRTWWETVRLWLYRAWLAVMFLFFLALGLFGLAVVFVHNYCDLVGDFTVASWLFNQLFGTDYACPPAIR